MGRKFQMGRVARFTVTAALTMTALGVGGALSPALAQINVGISIGTPPVVVAPAPAVVVEPGAPVYYYDGRYFSYYDGGWLVAERHEGPWGYVAVELVPQPVLALPGAYERMPRGHFRELGPHPWTRHEEDGDHERGHEHKWRERERD